MTKPQQIIAMGGGGFLMEPENPLLDQYVLDAASTPRPKVCFVPTASGDAQSTIDRYYTAFRSLNAIPTHLSLFKPPTSDLRSFVLSQDVIYVGGGSTRNLLVLWREWGLDTILREAWQQGIVLSGVSAGAICWFEEGLSDSVSPDELLPLACLGFLPGSNCPHYDGEAERRPSYQRFIRNQQIKAGYAADDGAALHFLGTSLHKIISSRPQAKAYRLSLRENQAEETPLETQFLGTTPA